MLFKNLFVYRLPADWSWTAGDLETRLGGHPLRPCGHFDMLTRGWQPVTKGGRLLHTLWTASHAVSGHEPENSCPHPSFGRLPKKRAEAQATDTGLSSWSQTDARYQSTSRGRAASAGIDAAEQRPAPGLIRKTDGSSSMPPVCPVRNQCSRLWWRRLTVSCPQPWRARAPRMHS